MAPSLLRVGLDLFVCLFIFFFDKVDDHQSVNIQLHVPSTEDSVWLLCRNIWKLNVSDEDQF